ncbi:MAG: Fic family protein [Flavisolibacter sp.]
MAYNWQQPDWPDFKYDLGTTEDNLFAFAEQTGHVTGILNSLPRDIEMETVITIMVTEAIKTSEIEGEHLNRQDVVSSIRNNLGLNTTLEQIGDRKAQGAGELMIDVRKTFMEALTEEKIFMWHRVLMSGQPRVNAGAWRQHTQTMQIISGAVGKERVHFEAPLSFRVPDEMERFIQWFNESGPGGKKEIKKAPVRSAIAHLYFESIHPFEDGNGRIGRAIAQKALSQTLGRPVLLSLSTAIEADKKSYYHALERAQKNNRITPWIEYFVNVVLTAQKQAHDFVDFILKKSRFFDHYKNRMNERQLKVVRRMLEEGPDGFEGGMNASKYISLTRASKATATRDLQNLVELGIFRPEGGGRSTRYSIVLEIAKT